MHCNNLVGNVAKFSKCGWAFWDIVHQEVRCLRIIVFICIICTELFIKTQQLANLSFLFQEWKDAMSGFHFSQGPFLKITLGHVTHQLTLLPFFFFKSLKILWINSKISKKLEHFSKNSTQPANGVVLVSLLLTLNIFRTQFQCFYR